ncbi:leucine zipper protein 2 isoform X2 [Erinaceus europaeus]|uniref:Leucine zipper protein 2 isoform X2 n=1 Tax=Erinaceus europaeus TaxID=9365 RepID=A0ABM3W8U4_ERIEU|nr:leucine zipper protein 2 isoform X2 [Erinaceus europaeus]
MELSPLLCLLPLLPALALGTRQDYEDLEKQLKEVFKERSTILHQLTKTSRELDGIKVNLQINFLKTELERKTKMIRDLQNENKSLKNKLLSGNKLCGLHAEESRRIQAQLKELRYGKKDLLLKAQQLTELEQKLAVARNELEKAALDKDSQMKAMKETVKLCLSTVFQNQPPPLSLAKSSSTQMPRLLQTVDTLTPSSRKSYQIHQNTPDVNVNIHIETAHGVSQATTVCGSPEDKNCAIKQENTSSKDNTKAKATAQKLQVSPCADCEVTTNQEKQLTSFEGRVTREEKIL